MQNGTFASRHDLRRWIELGSDSSEIAGRHIAEGHVNLVGRYWKSVNNINSVQLDGVLGGTIEQRLRTTRGKSCLSTRESGQNDLEINSIPIPDGSPRVIMSRDV